jgi:hypothetical protein
MRLARPTWRCRCSPRAAQLRRPPGMRPHPPASLPSRPVAAWVRSGRKWKGSRRARSGGSRRARPMRLAQAWSRPSQQWGLGVRPGRAGRSRSGPPSGHVACGRVAPCVIPREGERGLLQLGARDAAAFPEAEQKAFAVAAWRPIGFPQPRGHWGPWRLSGSLLPDATGQRHLSQLRARRCEGPALVACPLPVLLSLTCLRPPALDLSPHPSAPAPPQNPARIAFSLTGPLALLLLLLCRQSLPGSLSVLPPVPAGRGSARPHPPPPLPSVPPPWTEGRCCRAAGGCPGGRAAASALRSPAR